MMLIIYEILLSLYAVVCLPFLFLRGKWHRGFSCRLGFFSNDLKKRLAHPCNIWVHAVSVGEVMAVAELIRRLKKRMAGSRIVLSTSTQTGYQLAIKKFKDEAEVIWAPLDFRWSVQKFVMAIAPRVYVAAETELWPNLFTVLSRRRVPVVVVNGRISDQSYGRYRRIRWFMRGFLPLVDRFCMQSEEDVRRIVHLGALPSRVCNVGNVKFDDLPQDRPLDPTHLGLLKDAQVWVAGSTHPGEEEIVLNVWAKLIPDYPHLRLVIAPRHIERVGEVISLIEAKGFTAQKYSQLSSSPPSSGAMIVVDTIGQLRSLYSLADIVFVGKSFTVPGGHNIVEPAFYAKPVIVGPFMENFRDITAVFKKERAIIQLEKSSQLEETVRRLLNSSRERRELGDRARRVINQHTGATLRSVDIIIEVLHSSA